MVTSPRDADSKNVASRTRARRKQTSPCPLVEELGCVTPPDQISRYYTSSSASDSVEGSDVSTTASSDVYVSDSDDDAANASTASSSECEDEYYSDEETDETEDSSGSLRDFIVDDDDDDDDDGYISPKVETDLNNFKDVQRVEETEIKQRRCGEPRRSTRTRSVPKRYQDEEYAQLMLEDIPENERAYLVQKFEKDARVAGWWRG